MAEVQVIPPKAARPDTLRVAAYCRVSSDSKDQLHPTLPRSGPIRRRSTPTMAGIWWTSTQMRPDRHADG